MVYKKFLSIVLAFVMLAVCVYSTPVVFADQTAHASEIRYNARISGSGVRIRSEATAGSSSLGTFSNGESIIVHGSVIVGSDGLNWYKFEHGNGFAYVCADYVTGLTEILEYVPDATFEQNLTNQKFPESYKVLLRNLHANHPNWIFIADHLDLSWADAFAAESQVGKSLVSISRPDSYKSMEYGAYDWENNAYIGFDGTSWVTAHKDMVAYFMEPRNFLNENDIYQFLDQSFNDKLQNVDGINKIITNSFMAEPFPETTYKSYAELLFDAGKKSKVNPYVLSAMIIQEQGRKGESGLISGKYGGELNGFYNHFNIGAYATKTLTAVQRGLYYASGHPDYVSEKNKTKYGLPWNTIAKSIIGGSIWYGSGYIEVGQDTLYYKKWDFIGPNYYNHQYMSNVEGAYSEAKIMKNAYVDLPPDTALTFSIPVFKNMPEENKTSLPVQNGANNYFLTGISVAGHSLTPSFDKYRNNYELVVDFAYSKINVSATAFGGATVSGTGTHSLNVGENIIKLTVTAESGRTNDYILSATRRDGNGATVIPDPEIIVDSYNFGANVTGIQPGTTAEAFKSKIKITNGTMKLLDKNGKDKTSGIISTGDKLIVYKGDGKEFVNKSIVVYGDTSGDGKINIIDLAQVQKHIIKRTLLTGANLTGADTNKDGKVNIVDLAQVQKHIVKKSIIKQ